MKHALLKGLKYALYFSFLLLALLIGQVTQLLVSSDDIKEMSFQTWVKEDPSRQAIVNRYTNLCLSPAPAPVDETKEIVITSLEDCAKKHDALPAFTHAKDATANLSYAWPLSQISKL
ncbi:hypothetical protein ACRZ5S_23080 (plasmid) [Vibrio scophthalmi]|uniref:hypothetical protein n=1 Tax=Vibrio scophthalmi TaxID=45658 RepID=UPI003EBB7D28